MNFHKSKWIIVTFCFAVVATSSSCGKATLFKVQPFEGLPPMPSSAHSVDVGSLTFRAAPLLTDEESQELFEANLQLAGLLPIRIEINHNSGEPIELRKLKLTLHSANGEEWKTLPAKKAIARILSDNDIYAYNPASRKTFAKEFSAYELNLKEPLTHAERKRGGFLFFQSPRKESVASPHGLVLAVQGLSQPISIPLD
jgi:hypothetical protein